MSFVLPCSFAINKTQQLSLFDDGSGFVFSDQSIVFDFHYELKDDVMLIVLNDDASWADLSVKSDVLKGVLYSYISEPNDITWSLKRVELIDKPKATSALQAIRFHDKDALTFFSQNSAVDEWSQWLVEAATCGHEEMVTICLNHQANLNIDIETFKEESDASSLALTKAIQCGHYKIVRELLDAKANIHHHTFDLDRDNFYHACILYQTRPEVATVIIEMLLDTGVIFSDMSAYYLSAVMYTFPEGPLHQAKEDTKILKRFIDVGVRLDDFLTISAHARDTAVMFAAHMGLVKPLKLLIEAGANALESFEGLNALDRCVHPMIVDPLMPHQGSESIRNYLESLGLQITTQSEEELKNESDEVEVKEEDISSLEALFANLNRS